MLLLADSLLCDVMLLGSFHGAEMKGMKGQMVATDIVVCEDRT